MFERFTKAAKQVVVKAEEEARELKSGYMGTEHILLGLLGEEDGLAAQVLNGLGLTLEQTRERVIKIIGLGKEDLPEDQHPPVTPRAKKQLEAAFREALSLGHNYIGTEHILLAMVRENEGVGGRILADFKLNAQDIRNAVIRKLAGPSSSMSAAEREADAQRVLPLELTDQFRTAYLKWLKGYQRLFGQFTTEEHPAAALHAQLVAGEPFTKRAAQNYLKWAERLEYFVGPFNLDQPVKALTLMIGVAFTQMS